VIDWGPDSFAAFGGLVVMGTAFVFAAYEWKQWRRRKAAAVLRGPEQQFRTIIENFNRLDQSVTADSIGAMRTGDNQRSG
jgi:tRNA(Met) C34 N-acetyltransferase TmcA